MSLEKKPNRLLWIGIIVVLVAAIGYIFYLRYTTGPKPVDAAGCLQDGAITGHTVVLIDQSDPFSEDQRRWVDKKLNETARRLPPYAQATVLGLKAKPHDLTETYRGCSPGSPDQVNEAIANRNFIEFEWNRKFYEPMRGAANAILADSTEDASPILEAFETIAERPDFTSDTAGRRVVIVSDMIQNSSTHSFFRTGTSWSAFKNSSASNALPDLHGVVLEVHVVPRREYALPPAGVRKFWLAYAKETGAKLEMD